MTRQRALVVAFASSLGGRPRGAGLHGRGAAPLRDGERIGSLMVRTALRKIHGGKNEEPTGCQAGHDESSVLHDLPPLVPLPTPVLKGPPGEQG